MSKERVERRLRGVQALAAVEADLDTAESLAKSNNNRVLLSVVMDKTGQRKAVFFFRQISSKKRRKAAKLMLHLVLNVDRKLKLKLDSHESFVLISLSGVESSSKEEHNLRLRMLPGFHTQNFVSEVYKAIEEANIGPDNNNQMDWNSYYSSTSSSSSSSSTSTSDEEEGRYRGSAESKKFESDDTLDPSKLNVARESIVKYQLSLKEEEFTKRQPFSVHVATWNVNGQSPSGSIKPWLVPESVDSAADLYAVGFQELDLSKEAFFFNESPKETEWIAFVSNTLRHHVPDDRYKLVKLVRLVGMMMMVFVKEKHAQYVNDVRADSVGTGIMGRMGNKGGVAIRLNFHSTTVCFVNAHLAAHVSEVERRNQDYHEIINRVSFVDPSNNSNERYGIKDHEMIFFMGDLNYRITSLDTYQVQALLKQDDFDELFANDQFLQQREQKAVFVDFTESAIKFPPTYKYDVGTDTWDSSEKARAPAWTDRVLYKGGHIKQLSYQSHMEMRISDHKPVSAIFSVGMKVIEPKAYRRVYEQIMKQLDRLENEFLPQLSVDTTEINFDTVAFLQPVIRTLTAANTGQVPVQFDFIHKLDDESFCKPWLSVEPCSGFVMPGEKCEIVLEILVDKACASGLNKGDDELNDILVLHLAGGKDIFVTVTAEYKLSCFGCSIEALCRMQKPIAMTSNETVRSLEQATETNSEKATCCYPVPKELWFLCDLVAELGLENKEIFLQPGIRTEVLTIRDWLDNGTSTPKVTAQSAAEALLLFLESLREPIVPFHLYNTCLDLAVDNDEETNRNRRRILSRLPTSHRETFVYVIAFLREITSHSQVNNLDPRLLATLFADIFLRKKSNVKDKKGQKLTSVRARANFQLEEQRKANFVYFFIVNDNSLSE